MGAVQGGGLCSFPERLAALVVGLRAGDADVLEHVVAESEPAACVNRHMVQCLDASLFLRHVSCLAPHMSHSSASRGISPLRIIHNAIDELMLEGYYHVDQRLKSMCNEYAL